MARTNPQNTHGAKVEEENIKGEKEAVQEEGVHIENE